MASRLFRGIQTRLFLFYPSASFERKSDVAGIIPAISCWVVIGKLGFGYIPSLSTRAPNLLSLVKVIKTGSPIPHLSTFSDPLVFSSPLWLAVVPFPTLPATPQPVATSSSSFLPASSPSCYSNGSAELQHQVPDTTEESLHLEKSLIATTLSRCCNNPLSLSFGFIYNSQPVFSIIFLAPPFATHSCHFPAMDSRWSTRHLSV